MAAPLNPHEPLLVNTIGHFTGALVFGVFLFLLVRAGARAGRLTLSAAALALVWNLSSLLVLALQHANHAAGEVLVALGTSALSVLPAVLLHVSLGGRFRAIVSAGYAVGTAAVLIHGSEHLLPAGDWHRLALLVTTVGFAALTLLAAALLLRAGGRATTPRLIASMSLFLFSLTMVHTGASHAHAMWSVEMLLHHAGVPLALIVLLQDYRFLLVDTFARVVASFLLAAALLYAAAGVASLSGFPLQAPENPFLQGLLVMGICLLLLVYGLLSARLQSFLTRVLFGRAEIERALAEVRGLCASCADEAAFLDRASRTLGEFLGADLRSGEIAPANAPVFPALVSELQGGREALEAAGVALVVPLRLASNDVRYLFLGPD